MYRVKQKKFNVSLLYLTVLSANGKDESTKQVREFRKGNDILNPYVLSALVLKLMHRKENWNTGVKSTEDGDDKVMLLENRNHNKIEVIDQRQHIQTERKNKVSGTDC